MSRSGNTWIIVDRIPALDEETIRRTSADWDEMSEALCYGRDVLTHLSVIGMTIVKGR